MKLNRINIGLAKRRWIRAWVTYCNHRFVPMPLLIHALNFPYVEIAFSQIWTNTNYAFK